MNRGGVFWDMETGRIPQSPVRLLLGWKLLAVDPQVGTVRAQFEGKPEFLNPAGTIQGGLLSAMLDNTMGAALAAQLGPGQSVITLELKISFIHPAKIGVLIAEGEVASRGRSISFLEGRLQDGDGQLIAKASATALVVSRAVNNNHPGIK